MKAASLPVSAGRTSNPEVYNHVIALGQPESEIRKGSAIIQFIALEVHNLGFVIELDSHREFEVLTAFNDIDKAFECYRMKA